MSSSSSSRNCPSVALEDIADATNHFDEEKVLGKGGEATVYLAKLRVGLKKALVAVKHLKPNSSEFENEIQILTKIQHPNIVSLLGHCKESGQKILIYEYMENGSLSNYVKEKNSISLPWQQRLKICLDAARGLQRLHVETDEFPKGIIHRDVKPDNILLDGNWVGKISDFGMFKLSHAGQVMSSMQTMLKGTSGYYAPEYLAYNRVSRKIDIYAFGVVLFQVLCLKLPWDRGNQSYFHTDDEDLGHWAQESVDARIKEEISNESLLIFTDIIRRSLKKDPNKRPTIDSVVLNLETAMKCQNRKDEAKSNPGDTNTSSLRPKDPSRALSHAPSMGDVIDELKNVLKRQTLHDEPKSLRGSTSTSLPAPKAPRFNEVDHFPKKVPPSGEDKVILYTDDRYAFRACEGAKNILLMYHANIDVVERSLKYPRFEKELERLVGDTECPRLFVRGMDIGGIENIGKLHRSGKLNSILKQCNFDTVEDDIDDDEEAEEDEEEEEVKKKIEFVFPQKIPPGGENRVVLYTDDQSPSFGAKNMLKNNTIKFEERSILYSKFSYELKKLVGNKMCPRLFVRGMDIGGIESIGKLYNSEQLEILVKGQ